MLVEAAGSAQIDPVLVETVVVVHKFVVASEQPPWIGPPFTLESVAEAQAELIAIGQHFAVVAVQPALFDAQAAPQAPARP